jgi:hypothetical protein
MDFKRPTEFADYLVYVETYAPEFPAEDGLTHPAAFADAWKAIEYFIQQTPLAEGKELLRQCARNLHVAYEYYEQGDDITGGKMVAETSEMFRRCRKYIDLSDE